MQKHLELIARVIRDCPGSSNDWVHRPSFVAILAHEIKNKEPHFNVERFTKACGVESIILEEARRPEWLRGEDDAKPKG